MGTRIRFVFEVEGCEGVRGILIDKKRLLNFV